jgi:uncharacterized NAD-dependent epimerase/dehydratase family protein
MMRKPQDGNAIIYCEGAFKTSNGKTAHGLVRRTSRYNITGVVDSNCANMDAGTILDNTPRGIPIFSTTKEAYDASIEKNMTATHLVVGLAPDGGRLSQKNRNDLIAGIELGLNIDSGLHDFLSEDPKISNLAKEKKVKIRDIRKPPLKDTLHFFSGKIEEVESFKVAILGTDSAVGKRTTAWILLDALISAGFSVEMIGTGQTAWMQGANYCIVFDSLINDFVTGEIEHAIWSAWNDSKPRVIIIEGQGSLMNPAYPGGFEILAAGRPDVVILQHAPARKEYDGFPGYPIHPIDVQIEAIELISAKPVIAVCVNHENLTSEEAHAVCNEITKKTGLPAVDVMMEGAGRLVQILNPLVKGK